jgi:hypothetical protein
MRTSVGCQAVRRQLCAAQVPEEQLSLWLNEDALLERLPAALAEAFRATERAFNASAQARAFGLVCGALACKSPIGCDWSCSARRIGHLVPIWQPLIGSPFQPNLESVPPRPLRIPCRADERSRAS